MLIAKRLANLPGWKADLIAAAPFSRGIGSDTDLVPYAEAALNSVTRIAPLVALPWHRLGLLASLPDAMRFLNGKAVRAARRLGVGGFEAMLSWSQWHSAHLAARRIKQSHPRIPWLAHFSDPWVDNPFSRATGLERWLNADLERSVMEAADRILFTTPETVDLVMAKYPTSWRAKVRVIPHGFEQRLYSNSSPPPRDGRQLVARYVGNFYGDRTPAPLIGALRSVLRRRPEVAKALKVEIVGGVENALQGSLLETGLPDGMLQLLPPVTYRESLRLMETADLLLVIDGPAKISVFLPSKLVDYIGAGRPIVAFSPPGATARVIGEVGGSVANPADTDACAAALLAGFYGVSATAIPSKARDVYSARTTGLAFANILDELTGPSRL